MIRDMVNDLSPYTVAEIEVAVRKYRCGDERFFPRSGQIIHLIESARKERREEAHFAQKNSRPLPDSRPLMWWLQPRALWKPHWREDEIPKDAA